MAHTPERQAQLARKYGYEPPSVLYDQADRAEQHAKDWDVEYPLRAATLRQHAADCRRLAELRVAGVDLGSDLKAEMKGQQTLW